MSEERARAAAREMIADHDWCDYRGDCERKLMGFGTDAEIDNLVDWLLREAKGFAQFFIEEAYLRGQRELLDIAKEQADKILQIINNDTKD